MNNMAVAGNRALFTVSQWQELEHQALIFKYLMAGIPVPPDLLLPIRKSLDSSTAPRFFHHPTMVWGSYYGKKTDPEPGRCRRTDGKKWRCSKDAYPDSKYCERHMHRGRNRSRKPVETHPISQSSSTVTSLTPTGSSSSNSFQNLPLHTITNPQGLCPGSSNASQMLLEPASYGMTNKDYRYAHAGLKGEVDEHSFFSEASGSARGLGMDSSLDSTWRLMLRAQGSSYMAPKHRNGSLLQSNYPPLQGLQDLGHTTLNSALPKQQHHQHCFLGGEFGSGEPVKQEGQALRPFFDEWPKTRDSWSDLEEERSNRTSFSTTQLSISMPVASSDFSATSSHSPNDD